MKPTALVMDPSDNVATAIVPLSSGTTVHVDVAGSVREVTINEDIPFGFKFAIQDIKAGSPVLKYGEAIGIARVDIAPGSMVHVHNTDGARGRGDLSS
jgi:altronate dehydratase small subunit